MAPVPKEKDISKQDHINEIATELENAFVKQATGRLAEMVAKGNENGPWLPGMLSPRVLLTTNGKDEFVYKTGVYQTILHNKAKEVAEELYEAGMRSDPRKKGNLFPAGTDLYTYKLPDDVKLTPERMAKIAERLKKAASDEVIVGQLTHLDIDNTRYDLSKPEEKTKALDDLKKIRVMTEDFFDEGLTSTLSTAVAKGNPGKDMGNGVIQAGGLMMPQPQLPMIPPPRAKKQR